MEQSWSEFPSSLRSDVEAHLMAADSTVDVRLLQIKMETHSRVVALESSVQCLEAWRPRFESSPEALQSEAGGWRLDATQRGSSLHRDARPDGYFRPNGFHDASSVLGRPPAAPMFPDGPRFGQGFDNSH
jgi:hypothetical protein